MTQPWPWSREKMEIIRDSLINKINRLQAEINKGGPTHERQVLRDRLTLAKDTLSDVKDSIASLNSESD